MNSCGSLLFFTFYPDLHTDYPAALCEVIVFCFVLRSDGELKPSCCLVLDEDEGFSDWSHRLENRNEHEAQEDCRVKEQRPSASADPEKDKEQGDEEEDGGERRSSEEASTQPPEKVLSQLDILLPLSRIVAYTFPVLYNKQMIIMI